MTYQSASKRSALLASFLVLAVQLPAFCQHSKGVSNSIVIDVKPQFVYKAIQKARSATGKRLVSYKDNQAIIEENFDGLPLIGSAKCLYKENETSPTRIDYSLIESDKLSKFEGAWILSPHADGKTTVTLTSDTECGLKLPFADKLCTQSAIKRVERKLHEIAGAAEAEQKIATADNVAVIARK